MRLAEVVGALSLAVDLSSGLPFNPRLVVMRAGRLMVQMMREHIDWGESFAFETTLADRGFARSIPKWQESGYRVSLWFFALASVEAAIDRVAERVSQGGHFVPEDVIRRRFAAGRANFESVYAPLVDAWALYDKPNSEGRACTHRCGPAGGGSIRSGTPEANLARVVLDCLVERSGSRPNRPGRGPATKSRRDANLRV